MIKQKLRRARDVVTVRSGAFVQQVVTTNRFRIWIGKNRERVVCFATESRGHVRRIDADRDRTYAGFVKRREILFDTP